MSIKEKIDELRVGLRDGDVRCCGDSPKWIREELLQRLDALLETSSESTLEAEVKSFVIGAVRFVADRCGSECDQLIESLSEIA